MVVPDFSLPALKWQKEKSKNTAEKKAAIEGGHLSVEQNILLWGVTAN